MNPVYDFSAVDHAVMLGDQVRLDLYRRAIRNQVKPGMVVAEIGTGTGILSAYAAAETSNTIYGIEYFEHSALLADSMMKAAGLTQVKILNDESYKITLNPQPEILITETIGAIGPEENIVEICHDFKKRHPHIKSIIPSRLRICAEPIHSEKLNELKAEFYKAYESASFGTFDYKAILSTLEFSWGSRIRYTSLTDARAIGDFQVLTDYALGETSVSAFSAVVDLSTLPEVNAVHLFFEATLDQELLLTTHYLEPETHWGNAYVSRPVGRNILTVSYETSSEFIQTKWEKHP